MRCMYEWMNVSAREGATKAGREGRSQKRAWKAGQSTLTRVWQMYLNKTKNPGNEGNFG